MSQSAGPALSIGNGINKVPRINGKEVDLYLLYQIVTSHGGWEKVNSRNEWTELLEHFKLPRSANGGVAFKNIYLKYLELYEKVHFLGEDVDTHDDPDDDFQDYRHRSSSRRVDRKSAQLQTTPSAGNPSVVTPHPGPGPIPENLRIQHKLSLNTINATYDKLILTLQSPLPNEQDVAIGVCSLLSNETKHVIQLGKCPRLVDHLLAHAGVFSHCSLRALTEQVYREGRGYDHASFWRESVPSKDAQDLLCEHFVSRFKTKLGIDLYENDFSRTKDEVEMSLCEPESEYSKDNDKLNSINGVGPEWDDEFDFEPTKPEQSLCCASCVCHKDKAFNLDQSEQCDENENEDPQVVSIRRTKNAEQAGQRITQIAVILRNLSFEPGNAEVLGPNTTVQRFILLCIKCEWSNLSQLAWDTFGNLAKHAELRDPLLDPLSSMFISLATDAINSCDRFHLLRALEIFTGWFANETNEKILLPYFEFKLFQRICELLGINDIMLLIYTLECMLSMTSRGEEVCDQFARVEGSVDTLVSLVTVEAQSYGPKGCIAMRVVETVSTIQPIAQALKQQQLQQQLQGQAGQLPSGTPTGLPQIQQGMRAAYQQSQSVKYQGPPTLPFTPNSNPQKSISNMCATSTWTPSSSASQSPSSVPPSSPARPPPHIPNLSPTKSSPPPNSRPPTSSPKPPEHHTSAGPSTASGNVTQFGGQSQMQAQRLPVTTTSSEVYHPTFSATTPDGRLSEEGWAMAWIKGAFDQLPGTSVEQGELYRMYCAARKSPNTNLGMDQFILCVKTVYGPSIGPVLKMFGGGTQHSFIEGIRPKLATRSMPSAAAAKVTQQNSTATTNCVGKAMVKQGPPSQAPSENSNLQVCVTIPNRENATTGSTSTSPILKATLSRPPRLNSPPTVAQRQQNKLQQPEANKKQNSKSPKSAKKSQQKSDTVINGMMDSMASATSEECSISSVNSAASSESVPPPVITFEGLLQNGGNSSGESSKDEDLGPPCLKEELTDLKNQNKLKGMLVDLLERKVGPREASGVNGMIGNREIRISDKGLEIVDQEGNSNNSTLSGPPPAIPGLGHSVVTTPSSVPAAENVLSSPSIEVGSGSSDNAQQQMTFYADSGAVNSQVTFKGQISRLKNSSSATGVGSGNKNHGVGNDLRVVSGVGGGGDISGFRRARNGTLGANPCHSATINCKDAAGSDNARFAPDLLDKFNEISDLIMVSPEQLGIKRSLSSSETTGPAEESEQPPFKKPSLSNSNGCDSTPPQLASPSAPTVEPSANPNGATSVDKNSVLENGPQTPNTNSKQSIKTESESSNQNHVNSNMDADEESAPRSENMPANKVTATTAAASSDSSSTQANFSFMQSSATSAPSTPTSNSVVQYPVTIAMNHTPNQLSFARQLVLPSGQPILLKTQSSQTPLQGQVIISKTNTSTNEQMPKAIIIVQQQGQTAAGQGTSLQQGNPAVKIMPPLSGSLKHEPGAGVEYHVQKTQEQLDMEVPYLCEWAGCGLRFTHHQQVLLHATSVHCSERLTGAVRCEWGSNGCDLLLRKRYSLMTHLQDRHCSKQALEMALYRRRNKIEPPLPPQQSAHHPGYAPNAAFHAIRRHALQFMSPRELQDDNEGPVTKSIRLSAALILRNICMHSSIGRRKLRQYESHLANVGMSNVESSRTIAHILNELNQTRRLSK